MNLLKRMNRIFKFGIAGVCNTIVDWSTYFICINYIFETNQESLSKICGIVTGIITAYLLNVQWVFRTEFLMRYIKLKNKTSKAKFLANLFIQFLFVNLFFRYVN